MLGITVFLVVCIFTFDIKVSKVIQKIPILSSVIDTKILEDFEAINEHDEFYRAMMSSSQESSPTAVVTGAVEENGMHSIPDSVTTSQSRLRDTAIPSAIQNILPIRAKINDMGVQNISPTKKLFRLTLSDGSVRYIQVSKEDGLYSVVGK